MRSGGGGISAGASSGFDIVEAPDEAMAIREAIER
jgi:hypothetical protein